MPESPQPPQEPAERHTRPLRATPRHKAPKPVTVTETPVLNGMKEVTLPCGKCDSCKRNHLADCNKPWRGLALPDPHCSFCGHDPHDDECPRCPCSKRSWGVVEFDEAAVWQRRREARE